MVQPYKFNYTPPTEDYDLDRLKQALVRNASGKQGLEAMQPDLDAARGRRDMAVTPKANMYGFVNPVQALANATGTSRGTAELRNLQPQEDAFRADIAEGEGQESLFNLYNQRMEEQRAARKGAEGTEELNLTQNNEIERQRLAKETEARNQQNDALQRKLDSAPEGDFLGQYRDPATRTTISVSRDPKTGLTVNSSTGEPINIDGMVKIDDDGPGSMRGKAWTPTQTSEFSNIATQTRQVKRTIDKFKPKYAQINNLPTGFADAIIKGVEKQDLLQFIDKDTSAEAKEAMLWWADWTKLYTLPERYEAFGATLTDNELKSWATAELMNPGSSPELTQQRMQKLGMDMENKFLNLADSQLSTSPDSQRGHILKNTKGLADYDEFGEFGPTLNWEGKDLFINGEKVPDKDVAETLEEWTEPLPNPFGDNIPTDVWDGLDPEEQGMLKGLPLNTVIDILHKNGKLSNK